MYRPNFTQIILLTGLLLTGLLLWFAFANYRSAIPVAQFYLRGMALSMGQAIESIASKNGTLTPLTDFKSSEIAYFSIIDRNGTIRFHSNPDLIGEQLDDSRYKPVLDSQSTTEQRLRLGTGENVFEFQQQLHIPGGPLVLRLVLHTWQSDHIIQRARTGGSMILVLLIAAWGFGLWSIRLQQQDLKHREELIRKERFAQLGEFGAIVAHEVRTPLAGIKGFAQLLAERLDDPRQQQHASRIIAESERLEGLVNDLLVYARHDDLTVGSATVEEILGEVWESLKAGLAIPGLSCEIHGGTPGPVACRSDHLRQVFSNLFSNALQAMPHGGRLRVSLTSDDRNVLVKVIDTGKGFGEEIDRIFDPFFTTRASGSGLGLAVCKKIIHGCGGTITAANSASGGAEITLCLPLAKE